MGKVIVDITMSLDGFIAGPDDNVDQPLGAGGERLHKWVYGLDAWRDPHGLSGGERNRDSEIVEETTSANGAYVMGRRMFHPASGDWGDEPSIGPWGEEPPFHAPVFILTHHARPALEMEGGTTFTFVTEGLEHAVALAREAAGDRNVAIAGGADVIQQALSAGLIDEIQVHVSPVLFGQGRRLFDHLGPEHIELEPLRVLDSPNVAHLKYRVLRNGAAAS